MKVLVIGQGGREHALVWKIAKSPTVDEIVAAPGNAGIAEDARCAPVSAEDMEGQVALAKKEKADLVVIGPEAPLVGGLADRLRSEGIRVFGPSAAAARLEGSKTFAKDFMLRHGIPTADYLIHETPEAAVRDLEHRRGPCVVKADGLAAGKGVVVCRTPYEAIDAVREIMEERRFAEAGDKVVIEDLLEGEEVSVLAISDGERFIPMIPVQDHKAAYEGDTGPNTGGMGAYAPAPFATPDIVEKVIKRVIKPTIDGMANEGSPFRGLLYAGLMICDDEPYVLEYNVRFGDPECQPLVAMMEGDLVPVLMAAADSSLVNLNLKWHEGAAICLVLASEGYPGRYEKGFEIKGLDLAASHPQVTVFHAGTKFKGDHIVTDGGRVLGVTARGNSLAEAARAAYSAANDIRWEGMRMRRDIGHRALHSARTKQK